MGGGRILDVMRKPVHCPKCGQDSQVWPIIYKTGDMTETEFFLKYRKSAIMGGDNISRRPPIIWRDSSAVCCWERSIRSATVNCISNGKELPRLTPFKVQTRRFKVQILHFISF